MLIESTADGISAISATLTSTNSDKLLKIAAQGLIDLDEALVSSGGSININTSEDISIQLTSMTGKLNLVNYLRIYRSNRKLYVDNAPEWTYIKAYGLQIEGTLRAASSNCKQDGVQEMKGSWAEAASWATCGRQPVLPTVYRSKHGGRTAARPYDAGSSTGIA